MTKAVGLRAALRASLESHRLALLDDITGSAASLGLALYLVGGAVRDLLMGRATIDLDLVVEGDATRLGEALAAATSGRVVARSQFGTAKVDVRGEVVDLVSARSETYRRPGALPSVRPGTIDQDLARRDFTINAVALRLAPAPMSLLDPWNGRGDIAGGLVRVLHPASFQDDATRMLRAVRYEQRLGFRLAQDTEAVLRRDMAMLDTISGDRLRREMDLIFREEQAGRILVRAAELGLLRAIDPGMPSAPDLENRLGHLPLLSGQLRPLHFLALLAFSLMPVQSEAFIKRLNMPRTWAAVVRDLAAANEAVLWLNRESSPAQAFRRLSGMDIHALQVASVLAADGGARQTLQRYLKEWRDARPILNGRDLARMGVAEGPMVGALLEALRDARLEGRIHTREDEEALVKARLAGPTP